MPIREDFPDAGSKYMDGTSDGWEFRLEFKGGSLEQTYAMVKAFLEEEGYADIPLPQDESELSLFRLPTRNKQILMFEDNGYVHNPIKILFPLNRRNKRSLILCIYNENIEGHLLRFHKIKERNQQLYKAKPKKKKEKSNPEVEENKQLELEDLDYDLVFEPAFEKEESFG